MHAVSLIFFNCVHLFVVQEQKIKTDGDKENFAYCFTYLFAVVKLIYENEKNK